VVGERYAKYPNIVVISPEDVSALPSLSLDVVVLNSVSQYVAGAEFRTLLAVLARLLKKSGILVLGDIIPPEQNAIADAAALLRFAAKGGFFMAALLGLPRTFFSEYRRLRFKIGLSTYSEAEMLTMLHAAGFVAERRRPNIGHNQGRMTFVAHRRENEEGSKLLRSPREGAPMASN
jgi:hypothetical protein